MTIASRLALPAVLGLALLGACSKKSESKKTDETAAKAVDKPADKPAAPSVPAVPCDGPELDALAKDLDTAGGVNMELGTPESETAIKDAIAKVDGKRVAFKGCLFSSQGNDEVSFKSRADGKDVTCHMAGGEAGNRAFRDAAMTIEPAKLRLDVVGTVAKTGQSPIERYELTECTITAHE